MPAPVPRPRGVRGLLPKILLIAVAALVAFPTFSTGVDNQVLLRTELLEISRGFQTEVGVDQRFLTEQLRLLPRAAPEASVPSIIQQIATLGYSTRESYKDGYYDALADVEDAIAFYGTSADDPGQLRGVGGCTDRLLEAWFWDAPTEFDKWLAMALRRPRITVEYVNPIDNEFVRVPMSISSQVFTHPRDRLIFTGPNGSPSDRLRIEGIVGGSFTRLNENDANTTACLFGSAASGASITVTATGLGGPFVGNDTADSNGNWDLCLPGLKHGYYRFEADDGSRDDEREQGFLRQLRFTF